MLLFGDQVQLSLQPMEIPGLSQGTFGWRAGGGGLVNSQEGPGWFFGNWKYIKVWLVCILQRLFWKISLREDNQISDAFVKNSESGLVCHSL